MPHDLLKLSRNLFPILRWSTTYSPTRLFNDFLAGLTMAAVALPQAIAYSLLASMPTEYGLYTAIIPAFVQILFGVFPFNSLGPFAVIALMVGNALLSTLSVLQNTFPHLSAERKGAVYDEYPILFSLLALLTFSVGVAFLLITVFRLGRVLDRWITCHLIAGFTVAAAFSIITSQLKGLFGIKLPSLTGSFTIYRTLGGLAGSFGQFNLPTLLVGLSTMVLIYVQEKAEAFFCVNQDNLKKKVLSMFGNHEQQSCPLTFDLSESTPTAFPKVLISISLVSIVSYYGDYNNKYGVAIVGSIKSGLPHFYLPWRIFSETPSEYHWTIVTALLPHFVSIILVCYCTLKSVMQNFEFDGRQRSRSNEPMIKSKGGEQSDVCTLEEGSYDPSVCLDDGEKCWSQDTAEMVALSVSTILCACSTAFVPSASLSRSAILATQTAATSPLASTFSGATILIAALFLAQVIAYIPMACLSGIVIYTLFGTACKVIEIQKLYRNIKSIRDCQAIAQFLQWIVTFVAVVVFDPSIGIIAGILSNQLFSLITWTINRFK